MSFGENPLSNNIEPENNLGSDTLDDFSEQETAPASEELFVREVPPEYQELIDKENKFIELGEPYANNLEPRLKSEKELMSLIQQRVEGESVLDLGSGASTRMLSMSIKDWKAKRYIGVDLHRIAYIEEVGPFMTEEELEERNERITNMIRSRSNWVSPKQSQSQENAEIPGTSDEERDKDYNDNPTPEPSVQTKSRIISTSEDQISIKGDMLDAISRLEDSSIGAVIISGIERSGRIDEITYKYIEKLEQEIHRVLKTDGLFIVFESDIGADEENFNKVFSEDRDLLHLSVSEKIEKEED